MTQSTKKDKIMHSELDFRPASIITGHLIYNTPYKYIPDENDLDHRFFDILLLLIILK